MQDENMYLIYRLSRGFFIPEKSQLICIELVIMRASVLELLGLLFYLEQYTFY